MAKKKIKPPKDLFIVRIEPGGNGAYPKYEKFWFIEKYDQKRSDLYGEVMYREIASGLHFTKFFMWRAIRKELQRYNAGYQGQFYTINKEIIK